MGLSFGCCRSLQKRFGYSSFEAEYVFRSYPPDEGSNPGTRSSSLICETKHSSIHYAQEKSTSDVVIVKILRVHEPAAEPNPREIHFLQACTNHPNIIHLRQIFSYTKEVWVVLDYAAGGELFNQIVREGAYSEAQASCHVADVLSALAYLHNHNIIHRNLKPENLLLTSTDRTQARVCVADFGHAAIQQNGSKLTTTAGTWAYSAPEVLALGHSKGLAAEGYNEKCDLWSVGVLMFVLLSGTHPFDPKGNTTPREMQERIRKGKFSMASSPWSRISEEAKELLEQLLSIDPRHRPTATQALKHPWIVHSRTSHTKSIEYASGLDQYQRRMHRLFRSSVVAVSAVNKLAQLVHPDLITISTKTDTASDEIQEASDRPTIA